MTGTFLEIGAATADMRPGPGRRYRALGPGRRPGAGLAVRRQVVLLGRDLDLAVDDLLLGVVELGLDVVDLAAGGGVADAVRP